MRTRLAAGATALVAAVAITGCGQDGPAKSDITVVASTNVWSNVASAVGGGEAKVTSIISNPVGDPHSYQMTPKDAAQLAGARLVVFNGGGYDEFVEQALDGGGQGPKVVEAVKLDEHPASAAGRHEQNEHVWYRLATVKAVADEIAKQLGEIKPESKDAFQTNAKSFKDKLDGLSSKLDEIAKAHDGAKVVATEPVAHYLIEDAGLADATPAEFVKAIEEETDPPAAAVAAIQNLITQHQVAAVINNPQTETPVVDDVLSKAREAKVPIVDMTETIPAGQDYVTWMTEQISNLSSALGQT